MPIGIETAVKKYKGSAELSKKEKSLFNNWEKHKEEAKVTTIRMYPSTKEALKEYINSLDCKAVPDYAVLDQLILEGIKSKKK